MAQPLQSPEVHSDHRVTFRLRAPNAKEVFLDRAGAPRDAMHQDGRGVWSVTVGPLEPDFYGYSFQVDGVNQIDPSNSALQPNLLGPVSMLHVPGPPSLPWEINDVPHGEIHHHFFRSTVVGDDRDFYVYTPPGYQPAANNRYPVLYLLHGFSDDASAWTSVGRANVILDNLIAAGRAKPMIVVMPLGYGAPEILDRHGPGFHDAKLRKKNFDLFRETLFTEVMPAVERSYRVQPGRDSRAIAGLSMGGAESLYIGLNALDRFAWVGAFSSGGLPENLDRSFPTLDSEASKDLHSLWVACGTEDHLLAPNRRFLAWLKSKGIEASKIETPGAHTWTVWRRNLAAFAPLLFRGGGS